MNKTVNQKAWFLVLPVLVLVAFSAVIPLMTVVNYSVQDTFGNNQFFWAGLEWFDEMLHSERMWDALGRQLMFSGIILAILCWLMNRRDDLVVANRSGKLVKAPAGA